MKHTFPIFTAVFAVLAFLVSCGGSEGTGNGGSVSSFGGIYGHVTDYETGEDVANASVQLRPGGDTTLTGSDGMFEFRGLTLGDYSITVTKAGYSDLIDDYVITVRDRMVRRDVQIVNTECKEGYCCEKNITPCMDPGTNYIWSARARQDMDWDSAMAYCDNLEEGGYSDWTLPPKDVLKNFYDAENYHYCNKLGDTGIFWTSTSSYCEYYDCAYCVSYDYSDSVDDSQYSPNCYDGCDASRNFSVRCVRW